MGLNPINLNPKFREMVERAQSKCDTVEQKADTEQRTQSERREEIALHKQIMGMLSHHNIKAYTYSRPDRKPTIATGLPDFQFTCCGFPIAFEVKTATGKLSQEQIDRREELIEQGTHYFVVRDLERVKEILNFYEDQETNLRFTAAIIEKFCQMEKK